MWGSGQVNDHVFHRQVRAPLPVAVGGDGVFLIDETGKRYLDASGGAAVSCLGHGDAGVIAAIKDQLDSLAYAHTGFFTSRPAEELADLLIEGAPAGIDRVYFMSGGSEAIEAALKMARQYFVIKDEPARHRIIARRQSYHGNTLGALSTGGNPGRRALYEPLLVETSHIAPCYAYREMAAGENEASYGLRVADELEAEIQRLGPETVMAFVAETVVGATLGAAPAVAGYFRRIREICDRYGVLLILDEVMSGMGRTGTVNACDQDDVAPDMLVVAKGLGGGYQAIGAAMVSGGIYDAFKSGPGAFEHGHTYMGHPTACAAALAVQRAIRDRGLLENVNRQGERLRDGLAARLGQHSHIGDVRGRGLFVGVELVADRDTKAAFDPALKLNARIKAAAMENGLICYPGGGCIDGVRGDHVLLAPPFIVSDENVDDIVDRLARSIDRAIDQATDQIRG